MPVVAIAAGESEAQSASAARDWQMTGFFCSPPPPVLGISSWRGAVVGGGEIVGGGEKTKLPMEGGAGAGAGGVAAGGAGSPRSCATSEGGDRSPPPPMPHDGAPQPLAPRATE